MESEAAPLAYRINPAAEVSGLTRSRLYAAMKAGTLPYVQVGRQRLIRREDLDRFLADHVVTGAA